MTDLATILRNEINKHAPGLNVPELDAITAATVAIETSSASSSVSKTSTLGTGTNIINASTINIAATRASGTLRFDAANPSGGLRIRGTSGADSAR